MSKYPDDTEVPSFASKVVCAKCGARGRHIDVRPNWKEQRTGPEYSYNQQGAILLEAKDLMKRRGLPSPDIADALACTFASPMLAMRQSPVRERPLIVGEYDPFSKEIMDGTYNARPPRTYVEGYPMLREDDHRW